MRHYILGVGVDTIGQDGALANVDGFASSGKFHFIVTPNPEIVLLAHGSERLRGIINTSSLSLCDGTGLYVAGILRGKRFPRRIRGVDFMWEICGLAQKRGYRICLVGAEKEVRERVEQKLRSVFQNLQFSSTDPHITFVALGAPKQEYYIEKKRKQGALGVYMGVGGAFDMIAGKYPRAPRAMRASGLEWLWRFTLQPSRAVRVWRAVFIFPLLILLHDR